MTPDAGDRIARYEATLARLENARSNYLRRMPLYAKGFALLTALGFACFSFGVFPGLWGTISATVVSVLGYLMVRTRVWELTEEIAQMRGELGRLRAGVTSAGPFRDHAGQP